MGIFICGASLPVGMLGIYLMVNVQPIIAVIVFLSAIAVLGLFGARVAPLEVKETWWAP